MPSPARGHVAFREGLEDSRQVGRDHAAGIAHPQHGVTLFADQVDPQPAAPSVYVTALTRRLDTTCEDARSRHVSTPARWAHVHMCLEPLLPFRYLQVHRVRRFLDHSSQVQSLESQGGLSQVQAVGIEDVLRESPPAGRNICLARHVPLPRPIVVGHLQDARGGRRRREWLSQFVRDSSKDSGTPILRAALPVAAAWCVAPQSVRTSPSPQHAAPSLD